ncbi:MAG TPA: membrane dipeptidase [Chthoniobacterales bacterium]|nr:membrane dipeptidase [Chthoniobacterales bacterium]
MSAKSESIETRVGRLQAPGIVDLHFDLLIDLYEKRNRTGVLVSHFLPEFETGGVGILGVAIYIEDRYLPEMGLRVALDQVARLYAEVEQSDRFAICKTFAEIQRARGANKIALLITMEGVEPLGEDLNLLRAFYELGLRVVGLTHARRNAAGSGGIFKSSGSSNDGLTAFGRDLVRECERIGILIDLAHINPKGFEEIVELTTKPLIVSHTNARKFYDIERNISDEQIKLIGQRRGVIGVNAILVSADRQKSTIDRYIDHIEHMIELIGIDCVGIGFDFCEYLFQQLPESVRKDLAAKLTTPHFIPDLTNHSHAPNFTRKLIARGFDDEQIEKILYRNWMRVLEELL